MKKLLNNIDKGYIAGLSWATSTKGAMYILTALIWTSAIINPPTSIYTWLVLVVSVYYQGVALPGLGYQQAAESKATRQLMLDINEEEKEEIADIKEMLAEIKEMHQELNEILQDVKQK